MPSRSTFLPGFIAAAFLTVTALLPGAPARAQYSSGEIQLALRKLNVLGSVLYIGAHPDDENNAFLATMAKGKLYRTAYLSLTRGEGGQNLLGPEQGDALGIIRTQELLEARRVDGAEQYFTRAVDFGYSKSTDESLQKWGRTETLGDVVRIIRRFRPDVIVTRFTPERGGHGNHTASALLAYEAFRAAANPQSFPEQLSDLQPWQAKRIVWNGFRFGNSPLEQPPGSFVTIDLGLYNPLLGLSFGEIAGISRTNHKSQGFGALEQKGSFTNVFQHIAGDTATSDLFEGIDASWTRVPGGEAIRPLIESAIRSFDPSRPWESLPLLVQALTRVRELPPGTWRSVKEHDLTEVILGCAGISVEAFSTDERVNPGSQVTVGARVINRSPAAVSVTRARMTFMQGDSVLRKPAAENTPVEFSLRSSVPADTPPSQPYWLTEARTGDRYNVRDPNLIGMPETAPCMTADITLLLGGATIDASVPVRYRWVDPTRGEEQKDLVLVPPVSVAIKDPVCLSLNGAPTELSVTVTPTRANIRGKARLELPPGWSSTPAAFDVAWDSTLVERRFVFRLTGTAGGADGRAKSPESAVRAVVEIGRASYRSTIRTVSYPHIEQQTFLEPAESKLLFLRLRKNGTRLGYITGSGDDVAPLLERLGYQVTLLSDDDIERGDLARFDAIVAGVRAYNTRDVLRRSNDRLMDYVARGGRYVVQYVTRQRLPPSIGPYPLTISNNRVSVETAPVSFADSSSPLLHSPNEITAEDFDGWVQERGLNFASEWDPHYSPLLLCRDPGEEPQRGGLLFAPYGKGYFIYTGYSWFRELPAGVAGAFRLFVNLISQPVKK
jgi:LmbE family N-acetylglucosaminyl deacetylase